MLITEGAMFSRSFRKLAGLLGTMLPPPSHVPSGIRGYVPSRGSSRSTMVNRKGEKCRDHGHKWEAILVFRTPPPAAGTFRCRRCARSRLLNIKNKHGDKINIRRSDRG